MPSKLKVDQVVGSTGTTVTIPSGQTFTVAGTLGATSGANLTSLTSGNLTGALPAISGASLTSLNASNIGSGTVPTARLGTGTADSSVFLAGDNTWAAAGGAAILQVKTVEVEDTHSNTSSDPAAIAAFDIAFTPTSASSKLCLQLSLSCGANGERMAGYFYDSTGTAIIGPIADAASSRARYTFGSAIMAANTCDTVNATVWFTPGDTTTRTIQVFAATETSNIIYINRTYTDADTGTVNNSRLASTFTITEYDGTLVTIS